MEREEVFASIEPPQCSKCLRSALTADQSGNPLCARHATIFITLRRLDQEDGLDGAESRETAERSALAPAS